MQQDIEELVALSSDLSERGAYGHFNLQSEAAFKKRFNETGLWSQDFVKRVSVRHRTFALIQKRSQCSTVNHIINNCENSSEVRYTITSGLYIFLGGYLYLKYIVESL
jgi:hypothetical protein